MKDNLIRILFLTVALSNVVGCGLAAKERVRPEIPPAELATLHEKGQSLRYQRDIQPVLDRRCSVCHSCYNSPCQLKMTSFEGIARGATKAKVYDGARLRAAAPTRLFIDAPTTESWREKKFADVTGGDKGLGPDSFMYQLLELKEQNPEPTGTYEPESADLTCSQTEDELDTFIRKNPHAGMPFGFPEIGREERETLKAWLVAGARGPDADTDRAMKAPSNGAAGAAVLQRWEDFLNGTSPKMVTTARYLYEHLFLAHLYFDEIPGDFFFLVRSRTPAPEPIDEIATEKPYDDPGGPVYYRFRRIHSTIVYKTHILYRMNDARMVRYRELFLTPDWPGGEVVTPDYEPQRSANPFVAFRQIPPESRYRFMLDDSHYFVMTFIRGPVCKGQIALNVINDHFWVMFLDPAADLSLSEPGFLESQAENLKMPIVARGSFGKGVYFPYQYARDQYNTERARLYKEHYPAGPGLEHIWAGDDTTSKPFLTVYRHFDSATVVPGPVGGYPRTGWVIDYPQFERIYYSLVAGYNVFSNVKEQLGVRMYMDLLREEAEALFLNFLPPKSRRAVWIDWYPTLLSSAFISNNWEMLDETYPTDVTFSETIRDPMKQKDAFFDRVLSDRIREDIELAHDALNFHRDPPDRTPSADIRSEKDLDREFRKLTHLAGGFVRGMPEKGDLAFVRFVRNSDEDLVYTMILNRYHQNVKFIAGEGLRLDKKKDTIHVVKGFLGSYPNVFLRVPFEDAPIFFEMLRSLNDAPDSAYRFYRRFGVARSDEGFWEMSDYFKDRFARDRPLRAGLFDLNRYINDPRPPGFWDTIRFVLQ